MTREELRDYVEEQRSLNNISYHVYSALIDGIDTLEQEPRWIPVNERLPKDGERLIDDDVLVSCEDGEVRIGFCMGEDEIGNREWAVGGKIFSEPIAWMPLPAPYKAESEKQTDDYNN